MLSTCGQFLSCQVTVLFSPTLSMLSDESKHVFLALIRYAANYGTLPKHPGVLPYMGYIGMCRCEGYGFQAVYIEIGYINKGVWV